MLLWIILAVAAVAIVYAIVAFNRLVGTRQMANEAWSGIDVQLKRRHDLIPNLVNTVKGAMEFERSTLDAVISARNKAVSATGVRQTAQAEGELTQALGRLFALTEAYPDLKANQNILALQEELSSTENKIAFARQAYNDSVMEYNTRRESFPENTMAGMFGFGPAELLQATESAEERKAPKVSFS